MSLAAAPGDASVRLTWSDPSPADASIAKWQYRQKTTGAYGAWQDVPGGASARAADVTGLMGGTDYTFQVRAVDAADNKGAAGTAGPATPTAAAATTLWSATLTVDRNGNEYGCGGRGDPCASTTVLTDADFDYGGTTYTVFRIIWDSSTNRLYLGFLGVGGAGAKAALGSLTLNVNGTALALSGAATFPAAMRWSYDPATDWTDGQTVRVSLTAPAANRAATGKPSISGTVAVGQTLTAAKGTIADANGLTRADAGDAGYAYTYQWIRVVRVDIQGATDATDIPGATSGTYTLASADRGHRVQVRVGFKDDAGNAESRTSDVYPPTGTETPPPTPGVAIWSATLTADQDRGFSNFFGCDNSDTDQDDCSSSTVLTDDDFEYGGTTYTIAALFWNSTSNLLSVVFSGSSGSAAKTALGSLTLNVDGTALAVRDATAPKADTIQWAFDPATDWTDGQTVSLSLTGPPPPTPAGPGGLVSNVGQPAYPETFTFKWDRAQAFTTGSAPGGYRLTGVDIRLADTGKTALARTAYSVKLHEALPPHRGEPGRVLATLANPDSLPRGEAGGIARFTASGGVDLAPRSRYFVVIDVDGTKASRRVAASTAGSTAEDAGGAPGWSIEDTAWRRKAASTGKWTEKYSLALQIAVHGATKAGPAPDASLVPSGAIWSSSLTVDRHDGMMPPHFGCGDYHRRYFDLCSVVLSDDDFVHGGKTYRFGALHWEFRHNVLRPSLFNVDVSSPALSSLTLHVDGRAFAFADLQYNRWYGYHWPFEEGWTEGQFVTLALTDAGTTRAAPEASGPAFESARVRGAQMALRFDAPLDESSVPAASAFSVSVAGSARAVSQVAVSQDLVMLTLAEAVAAGEAVTVGYAPPSSGKLRAPGGAAVAAFSGTAVTNDTPAPEAVTALTASVSQAPAEHKGKGKKFTLRIAFSEAVAVQAKDAGVEVSGGTLTRAARVDKRADLWALTLKPSGYGAVTVTLPAAADCAAAGAICTADGRALASAFSATVKGPVTLSVADARAREGEDATIDFAVTLSRAASGEVTVRYATRDGTAKKGEDYRKAKGTLSFAAGETEKTVSVTVLDDAVDEGEETFTLRLSKATGAVIADGEATGTIENDDPLQKMWLARFGRTVAGHLTDAVSERLSGLPPGAHATLAGQSLDLSRADDGKALAEAMTGLAQAFGAPAAEDDGFAHGPAGARNAPAVSAGARTVSGRELLLGSSFHVAGTGEGSGPALAAWGRAAQGRFDGEEGSDGGRMRVDGTVLTGTLGADADWGRVLAGVAVSLSEGEGTFDQPGVDRGSIESTLTTVSPYARFRITERVSAWGLAGWGTGSMTIVQDALPATDTRPDARERIVTKTDIAMQLGAVGARGALLEQADAGGMDLVLRADAFFVRMESEKAANSAETEADASRVRLVLEGGHSFALSDTATLRPSLELGVRHDGGDAETGAGVEIGGGVSYADTASGLSLEARARMLVAHADSDYEEWGASATARLDPGERGRGLSFSLSPALGATSSAAEQLWGAHDARGLAPGGTFEAARGLRGEAGYGLAMFGDRFTGTPNLGFGLSDGGARDWRIGWRLTSAVPGDPGFEVSLDATRTEAANDNAPPEHGIGLRLTARW